MLVSCTLYNIYLDKFVGIDTYSLNSLANVLGLIQEGVYSETTLKFLNLAVCGPNPFRNPLPLAGMDRNQSPELRTIQYIYCDFLTLINAAPSGHLYVPLVYCK